MSSPAETILTAWDAGTQIPPLTKADPMLDLDAGYRIAAEIARARQARGETVTGRKIGFTNRTIWPIYNVHAPIWSWMYDTTLFALPPDGRATLPNLPEPRIEPEIAFHFKASPQPGMSLEELAACIEAVSHGFEVVVSLYPGWRFLAGDSAAAFAMHGAYWHGAPVPAETVFAGGLSALEDFTVTLECAGKKYAGRGRDLLDGPLHALRYILDEIGRMPGAGPILPGEIVTTGTLTDAIPVARGQTWVTTLSGTPLPGTSITFA